MVSNSSTELMDCFYMALPVHLLEMLPAVVARVTPTVVQMSWPEMTKQTAFLSVLFSALKTGPNLLLFLLTLGFLFHLLVGVFFLNFLSFNIIRTALGRSVNTFRWLLSLGPASERTPLLIVTERNHFEDSRVASLPFPFQCLLSRNSQ
jgi:hypothetical protein